MNVVPIFLFHKNPSFLYIIKHRKRKINNVIANASFYDRIRKESESDEFEI